MFTRSAETGSHVTRATLLALCVAYALAPLLTADMRRAGPLAFGLMALGAVVCCVAFVGLAWPAVRGTVPTTRRRINFLVIAYLATGMCLRFGLAWAPLLALSAAAAALVLARYKAVAAVGAVLAVEAGIGIALGAGFWGTLKLLGEAAIVVAVVYTLGALSRLGVQLERSRAELARLAVLEERFRLARDLHDMLGHTLSVVAVKSEVASRLVTAEPDRAQGEMRSVAEISRRAIGDVRELVRGYRSLSLEGEIEGVAGVLDAAGVRCTVDVAEADLPSSIREALAWVVREGGTNVLRHSQASQCEIRLSIRSGAVVLELTNDGVQTVSPADNGNGLNGLAERLDKVGGKLKHDRRGGRFHLLATAPVDQPTGGVG
jgi:two-component system sensor histidine kinase DesK